MVVTSHVTASSEVNKTWLKQQSHSVLSTPAAFFISLSMSVGFFLVVARRMLHLHCHISVQVEVRENNKRLKTKKRLPAVCFFKKVFPFLFISLNTAGSPDQKGAQKGE